MANYSRMAMEVNKLIAKELLSSKPVFLPQVGSLFITLDVSSRTRVEFTPNQQMGESIVDIICKCASCTNSQAQDIYRRWLEEVKSEPTINIEGIGSIRANMFMTTESFALRLNPAKESNDNAINDTKKAPEASKNTKQVKPSQTKSDQDKSNKKKMNKVRIVFPVIILCILVIFIGYVGCFVVTDNNTDYANSYLAEAERYEEVSNNETIQSNDNKVDSSAINNNKVAQTTTQATETKQVTETKVTKPISTDTKKLRFKVVYGVFSTRENAEKAMREIEQKKVKAISDIYTYGDKFLVSIYESATRNECLEFINTHQSDIPGIWVYERKY